MMKNIAYYCVYFLFCLIFLITFMGDKTEKILKKIAHFFYLEILELIQEAKETENIHELQKMLRLKTVIEKNIDKAKKFDEKKYSNQIFWVVMFESFTVFIMSLFGNTQLWMFTYIIYLLFFGYYIIFFTKTFFYNQIALIINNFLYVKILLVTGFSCMMNAWILKDENDTFFNDFGKVIFIILGSYIILLIIYRNILKIYNAKLNYFKLAISIISLTIQMLSYEVYVIGNYGETKNHIYAFSVNGQDTEISYFDSIYYTLGTIFGNSPGEIYPINRIGKVLTMKIIITAIFCLSYLVENLISKHRANIEKY